MKMKWVCKFEEGVAGMKELLGGKGAHLSEMTGAGLPVPPGFTVTTEACRAYLSANETLPDGLLHEIHSALAEMEGRNGQRFGGAFCPLLVSVRSGSVISMPGMMDTLLNLGLNDVTVMGLAETTGNARFAFDCYRRLIQMFGNVVFGIEPFFFEQLMNRMKDLHGFRRDQDVTAEAWSGLVEQYKELIKRKVHVSFPQDVFKQLEMAVEAVFRSWNNPRAVVYRKIHRISEHRGTAVNIQSMVFGNLGEDSGTGVVFTRNPSTGEKVMFGEFLTNAQGEDVVAGVRTPVLIDQLKNVMPAVYDQLVETARRLELHYQDMQDIEFTIEKGILYLLQTRCGKRTAQAAIKIAVDLVNEGVITTEEAIQRIEVEHLDKLLHRSIDTDAVLQVIAKGLPASPGAATGQVVFDANTAVQWVQAGKHVILVSSETTPEDIQGVLAAEGVVTSRGGMTSHAAVVARGMGKPCICGCEEIRIDLPAKQFLVDEHVIREGDWISIDGSTGRLLWGAVPMKDPQLSAELTQLLEYADSIRSLKIFTNADNSEDARKARHFGAEGIGLCRTEHMFMEQDRLPVVQKMIMAENAEERNQALGLLLPIQQRDFEEIFQEMDGLPVTIRLLDPPLHEFLPNLEQLQEKYMRLTLLGEGTSHQVIQLEQFIRKVSNLREANPMMGFRGCRLGILIPEIYQMQVEAIFRAVLSCCQLGIAVKPQIMIPLIGHVNELRVMRELVEQTADRVLGSEIQNVQYQIGTMIEVPRAALTAKQIAEYADFFSFGTNDLTQMTFGFSRDDAEGKFLTQYIENNLLPANPFQVLDDEGVGRLIRCAVEEGRQAKTELKTGVCGEHGGDKASILFCDSAGLNYVSCSPYRIPLARIAAAQAKLLNRQAASN